MSALKIYSNSNNFSEIFVYVLSFTCICGVVGYVYLYIDTYIRNINNKLSLYSKIIKAHSDKIKNSNKRIECFEGQLKKLNYNYQVHGQYISGMSKEINGLNHIYEKIESDLRDLSIHSHTNMDKIFLLENKKNTSFDL